MCAIRKTGAKENLPESRIQLVVLKGKRKAEQLKERLAESFEEKQYDLREYFNDGPKEVVEKFARVKVRYNGKVISVKITGNVYGFEERIEKLEDRIRSTNFGAIDNEEDTTEFEIPLTLE
jgi:hypothetical protein